MTKQCTKCKIEKSFSAFYKLKHGKDGLRAQCIMCDNKEGREYDHTHRVKTNIRRKRYRRTIEGCLRTRFHAIKQRCVNPKNKSYKNYGGRGIECLFENADAFVNYIINELKIDPRGLFTDRIENNGNYEYGNIRFVTAKESANNRRKKYNCGK